MLYYPDVNEHGWRTASQSFLWHRDVYNGNKSLLEDIFGRTDILPSARGMSDQQKYVDVNLQGASSDWHHFSHRLISFLLFPLCSQPKCEGHFPDKLFLLSFSALPCFLSPSFLSVSASLDTCQKITHARTHKLIHS